MLWRQSCHHEWKVIKADATTKDTISNLFSNMMEVHKKSMRKGTRMQESTRLYLMTASN